MSHTVTLCPGDTTGPELIDGVLLLIASTGVSVDWRRVGWNGGDPTPELIAALRETGVGFLGWYRGNREDGTLPPIVRLRRALGVYANLREARSLAGLPTRFENVDLLVVRETTEDVYAHLEHESIEGVFESLKVTTEVACERIARVAFEMARLKGRKKVTVVHKANILKMADGLFLRTGRRVATEFPDITQDDMIVDALCEKLVVNPLRYDVLLCGNLYGDLLSDLAAGLVGGRSNCPSLNLAKDVAVITVGHGDPPEDVGTGRGNPISLVLAATLLLRQLGEEAAAARLRTALEQALGSGSKPIALGGELPATGFLEAVGRKL